MTFFKSKVVLITGSGGGLGRYLAGAYLEAGAHVVLCDIHEERLKAAEEELSGKGPVFAQKVDAANEESVKGLFRAAVNKFGRIDVVVNNAAIFDALAPVGKTDKALWDRVISVNLTGNFIVSKEAVNQFLVQEPQGGNIVNVGSIAGLKGYLAGITYTASKHALRGMTMNIASYYGKKGIRCNLVQPGGMDTELYKELEGNTDTEGLNLLMGNCPGLKDGSAMVPLDKMSSLIMFLSSDSASSLNGQILNADNGAVSSA
ncbi:unnamed protein product [Clonostachys rhizophaga]|uniref:Uncharacterized protein n=1 Tax=Clonostachys rhizophaga TaxID=160324 RepID=A0A9N9YEL8_9HYPO|nr:unnamed protein product [Clonostachys rhizophaga]